MSGLQLHKSSCPGLGLQVLLNLIQLRWLLALHKFTFLQNRVKKMPVGVGCFTPNPR